MDPSAYHALFLDGIAPVPPGLTPVVHAMAGVPGAGKTTFVAKAVADGMFPASAFILNPDRVMEAMPGYRDAVKTLGKAGAFAAWEMPARDLAYALAHEAAHRRLPIIKDMGMVRAENWDMLARFKASGYRVELHVIDCPVDIAAASVRRREEQENGRHFPATRIGERAAELRRLLRHYAGLPDAVFCYERRENDIIPTSRESQTG